MAYAFSASRFRTRADGILCTGWRSGWLDAADQRDSLGWAVFVTLVRSPVIGRLA
jgi:hypothetical protein